MPLKQKTRIITPKNKTLGECIPYFPATEARDVLHAATAMDANAVIVTNDKHFKKIKETGK